MILRAVHKYDKSIPSRLRDIAECCRESAVECLRRNTGRLIPTRELVVRGEKRRNSLLSSVDSCERQVLLHEEAEEYSSTFPFEGDVF